MAVRACVVEGKGDCSAGRLDEYRKLMTNLWNEISAIADDDKVILQKSEEYFIKIFNVQQLNKQCIF